MIQPAFLVLLLTLAAPQVAVGPPSPVLSPETVRQQLLAIINEERAAAGVSPCTSASR